jgi:hypothetical protein
VHVIWEDDAALPAQRGSNENTERPVQAVLPTAELDARVQRRLREVRGTQQHTHRRGVAGDEPRP